MEVANKGVTADFLRRLFFPTQQDFEQKCLNGRLLQIDAKWFTQWTLPQLRQPYAIGTAEPMHTRRPGLLTKLHDTEYQAIFENIMEHPGLLCPAWYVMGSRLSERLRSR